MNMISLQRRNVEYEIKSYKAYKLEYDQIKQDILYGALRFDDENVGGGKSNLPTKPTEDRVIAVSLSSKLQRLDKIIRVVEMIYMSLDSEKQAFMRMFFWERKFTIDDVASELHISRRTAFRWKKEIINSVAVHLGY